MNRTLSDDSRKPSTILTDMDIYCDVEGTVTKNGKYRYRLSITSEMNDFRIVKEKTLQLSQGDKIKPALKFSNFTSSNPYKSQKVRVEFNEKSKTFYFDGIRTN